VGLLVQKSMDFLQKCWSPTLKKKTKIIAKIVISKRGKIDSLRNTVAEYVRILNQLIEEKCRPE